MENYSTIASGDVWAGALCPRPRYSLPGVAKHSFPEGEDCQHVPSQGKSPVPLLLEMLSDGLLFQNAIKMKESGKLVKYGYAVFEDRFVAERLLQQGNLAIADGVAVKISPMVKS